MLLIDMLIYVATHKSFDTSILPKSYIPLHVGMEGKVSLGYLGDNTGDNISLKNDKYCELTGLYWIWKNSQEDIVGLCHYRRFFVSKVAYSLKVLFGVNCGILKEQSIKRKLRKHDMIVYPFYVAKGKTIYQRFAEGHNSKDLDAVRNAIEKLYPDYLADYDLIMNGREFYYANMFIARKEVINEYCKWLFDVFFEAEKHIDTSGYDSYQKRVMGFISERVFEVWITHNKINICKMPVIMTEDKSIFKWLLRRKK